MFLELEQRLPFSNGSRSDFRSLDYVKAGGD